METTYHVGKLLEKVINGSTTDYRHYIYAGNELVVIYSRIGTGYTHRYVVADHQGSYATIISNTAGLDVRESFTAYGDRRDGNTWTGPPSNTDETTINGISRGDIRGDCSRRLHGAQPSQRTGARCNNRPVFIAGPERAVRRQHPILESIQLRHKPSAD